MIDEIQVSNLALIEEVSLEPAAGLTVLTGETGAGKSALLSALQLLMGERADKLAVRQGCDQLRVSGRFYDKNGTETIVNRKVSADGRSRVNLNADMASVNELAQTIAPTIDLCGQSEHQQLTKPATHVDLLDAWIGQLATDALSEYRTAFDAAAAAEAELNQILEVQGANSAALDEARFVLQRINAVNPDVDEYETLVAELARFEHAETLAVNSNLVYSALNDEGGALDKVHEAIVSLDGAVQYDVDLQNMAEQLRGACATLEDVAADARAYRDSIDFDAQTLEAKHERLAALQGLMRAYGPRLSDVIAARDAAQAAIDAVDNADEVLAHAKQKLAAAEEVLAERAGLLAGVRSAAAPEFAAAVTAQMQRLEMGSASLVCEPLTLERSKWTRSGNQSIEFMFKAGADMTPRPLAKIASGGEISRVMLACKVVLGASDNVDTLVFDEVDAGVGGSTANALAGVIADLAKTHQVIVVTHLAQVAVYADAHYVVSKTADDMPRTQLTKLSAENRVNEIARMLSGDITPTSLAHAAELLNKACS